jgi:hypothetical protein
LQRGAAHSIKAAVFPIQSLPWFTVIAKRKLALEDFNGGDPDFVPDVGTAVAINRSPIYIIPLYRHIVNLNATTEGMKVEH